MQDISVHINFIGITIFIGVCFGFFISFFLIKKSYQSKSPNIYMGLLILVLSLVMFEGWLNYTSYIFKALWLTNFSEPLNFVIAPLIYLFMTSQLGDKRSKTDWLHFIPFVLWLGYCMFFFFQVDVFKYNDSIGVMNLDIPYLQIAKPYTGDPLGIRDFVNITTIFHVVVYNTILTWRLIVEARKKKESIFKTTDKALISLRNSFYHFLIITLILIFVKSTF